MVKSTETLTSKGEEYEQVESEHEDIFARPELTLSKDDFFFFKEEIKKRSGINLSQLKTNLVQSRLRSRVVQLGLSSFQEYRQCLQQMQANDHEWQLFINQLTTNKTEWFREELHFQFLVNHFLPSWEKSGKAHLNVWCGASSTGEEPYSLGMVLHQYFQSKPLSFSILATDIDTSVLQFGANGIYPKVDLDKIPSGYHSLLDRGTADIIDWLRINHKVKNKITFEKFNLTSENYPWSGHFDLIFLRNVLIYFDEKMVQHVSEQCFKAASPEAALFIAHSESLQNLKTSWNFREPSIYKKGKALHW